VIVTLVGASLSGCDAGENEIDYDALGLDPPLAQHQIEAIQRAIHTEYDLNDIVLPNGWSVRAYLDHLGIGGQERGGQPTLGGYGPQTQKNALLALVQERAWFFTNDDNFQYPDEGASGGVTRPAQHGLAYSWGSDDHTIRRPPPGQLRPCANTSIYGLDCSGFIYNLWTAAGLDLGVRRNANAYSNPSFWNAVFNDNGLPRLRAAALDNIAPEELETGDMVFWRGDPTTPTRATHVGIVLETEEGELALFHAPGLGPPTSPEQCMANYGPQWGPMQTSLDDSYWFDADRSGSRSVVRITTDISGAWLLFGRCVDQSYDAFELELNLVSPEDHSVAANGTGTDYNGQPLNVVLEGSYTRASNTLRGDLTFTFINTGGTRIDRFQHRLNEDDTGYFPATLIYHSSSGCPLLVRLVSGELAPLPPNPVREPDSRLGVLASRND
jgi:hypothetical protein